MEFHMLSNLSHILCVSNVRTELFTGATDNLHEVHEYMKQYVK